MSVACDGCATTHNVIRGFVTVWNGNIFDLCPRCAKPLVPLLDTLWYRRAGAEPAALPRLPGEP